MSDEPKLHIDSDWKAQAQAEKDRLAEKEAARAAESGAGMHAGMGPEGELPPADFRALVASLASQAMMGLGAYGDPQTGRVVIDIVGAQYAIELLGVLEEKTKGNLSEEEAAELKEVLAHLRARFVQIAKLVAAQMQREMAGGPGPIGSVGAGSGMGMGMGMGGDAAFGASSGAPAGGTTSKSGLIIPD